MKLSQKAKALYIENAKKELQNDSLLQYAVINGQYEFNKLVKSRANTYAEKALQKQSNRIALITQVSGKCKVAQKPKSFFVQKYTSDMLAKYNLFKIIIADNGVSITAQ